MKLYNTLTREEEVFKPLKEGQISMYQCGPTVYNIPHIGNYRTFVTSDIIRRVFEYNGYKVNQVMNITDIDDKTIKGSREANLPLKIFTTKYEEIFLKEIDALNIKRPHHIIKATDHIEDMISMINILLEKNFAYKAEDGIYLSITKVPNYGQLARLNTEIKTKERITNDEYDKEDPRDFSLWKFYKEEDGETRYKAPFGDGRPGWHIECSAMVKSTLGPTIDIHMGGSDLIFPHHTNEIAQSECATGQKLANYWIHTGFLNINEEKMSKSKNNFFRLSDLLEENISPLSYRYWLLTSNYRSPANFSFEAVKGAQNALFRLFKAILNYPDGGKIDNNYKKEFIEFINNDFGLPQAIALSWKLIADEKIAPENKKATLFDFDKIFGLGLDNIKQPEEEIPPEIQLLIDAHKEARIKKDWVKSDALRKEINDRGYSV